MWRAGFVLAALTLIAVALAGAMRDPASTAAAGGGGEELSPAMATKFANVQTFAPPGGMSGFKEGERSAADDEWLKHVLPGTSISSSTIARSSNDWDRHERRGGGNKNWKPLGPTWAKSLPNPYRDRAVYNAGTPDFSGRIAHTVIDPNCGSGRDDDDDDHGSCRLWIAVGAGGGVWRTNNALGKKPQWKYLSKEFEHNSTSSLELDPNDKRSNTLWVGTGEANACSSGCEAGVGIYKSRNGGESWSGPLGQEHFYNRAVGSIEVKKGDSNVVFAASARAIRGISATCCAGVDALIPGAPHFGLYRSTDGGRNWQLVNQGADVLCTAAHPDIVSGNTTVCSPRGARRVKIDPVDPNTVYASFFARGIWRSKANGALGTWEQIMTPVGSANTERAEFDVVRLPSGETRMYVGVGSSGTPPARFRRHDAVRNTPAAAIAASWMELSNGVVDTPGYSSWDYCHTGCWYNNYVFAPAAHFPNSGASPDVVYLSGDNAYNENNWGPGSPRAEQGNPALGRDNARGVALSVNAGVHFTDMTDDDSHDFYPVELHPDHHALTVNPRNWRQFFDVGDGGIVRSNGRFIDDSEDCVQPKGYTGTALTFCRMMLSMVPERLTTLNKGLRTIHFYQIDSSPHDYDTIVGGTQDNGSWEIGDGPGSGTNRYDSPTFPPAGVGIDADKFPSTGECLRGHRGGGDEGRGHSGGEKVWVNTNIADGGHNGFDIGDPCFRLGGWQQGQTMVAYDPKNQMDQNWTSDRHWYPCPIGYACEAVAFIGLANDDHTVPERLWSAREHVFRSDNQGRNEILTKQTHREHCNVWYGDADVDDNGQFELAKDICDDWTPLGDPGPNGRLTGPAYGADKVTPLAANNYVSQVEPAWDGQTLWAATAGGRVFVSKNAGGLESAVIFDRIDNDPTALNSPARFPSAIYVDPKDPNHAWITFSGFNSKTPGTPGHVFEVRYVPGASTFRMLDGNEPDDRMGDIPANAIAVDDDGTIYVGTDYGCVSSKGDGRWRQCGGKLPRMPVSDLILVRDQMRAPYKSKGILYAGTHGQGVWELRTHGNRGHDDDDDSDDDD